MKDTPYTQNMAAYAENTDTTGIDTSDYSIGAQVNKCIPAKWWNTLFGDLVRRVRQSHSDFNAIYQEFLNVLSEAGIEPDEEESNQLLQALEALRDAQPLATHNSPGYVKSAGGKVNVSVNPSTGIMTANGVGSLNDSVSGIASNPSVTTIISALTYLSNNISGQQLVIPPKPEHWTIGTGTKDGTITNAWLVAIGEVGTSVYHEFIVPAGWHKICIWGGTGGQGGTGGRAMMNGSGSSQGGSISVTPEYKYGSVGSRGVAGNTSVLDVYFPTETKLQIMCGGGGRRGNNGGSPYVNASGSISSGSIAAASAVAKVNFSNSDFYKIASRLPTFLRPVASAGGSTGQSGLQGGASGSNWGVTFYGATGGGGGAGGIGGCTMVKFGKSIMACTGGSGGAGGSSATGKLPSNWSNSGGGSTTFINFTGKAGAATARAAYEANARLPVMQKRTPIPTTQIENLIGERWSTPDKCSEPLVDANGNPDGLCLPIPLRITSNINEHTVNLVEPVRNDDGKIVSVPITGPNDPNMTNPDFLGYDITLTPIYTWTNSTYRETDGMPGGVIVLKGDNI